jgi:hypothetical protein
MIGLVQKRLSRSLILFKANQMTAIQHPTSAHNIKCMASMMMMAVPNLQLPPKQVPLRAYPSGSILALALLAVLPMTNWSPSR